MVYCKICTSSLSDVDFIKILTPWSQAAEVLDTIVPARLRIGSWRAGRLQPVTFSAERTTRCCLPLSLAVVTDGHGGGEVGLSNFGVGVHHRGTIVCHCYNSPWCMMVNSSPHRWSSKLLGAAQAYPKILHSFSDVLQCNVGDWSRMFSSLVGHLTNCLYWWSMTEITFVKAAEDNHSEVRVYSLWKKIPDQEISAAGSLSHYNSEPCDLLWRALSCSTAWSIQPRLCLCSSWSSSWWHVGKKYSWYRCAKSV